MLSFESPVITPWHRVPIGVKLAVVCITSLLLFIFDSIEVQLFALSICSCLYVIAGRVFFKAGIKRLYFLWPILLIILVWHGVTDTAAQGLVIALRLVTIIALSNLMTMTSRLSDMLGWIQCVLKPIQALGVNTRPVEIAIALVVRFTPVLIAKGGALRDAWRSRSVKKGNWRIVFPLFLVAIDDAEQVAEALKARGGTLQLTDRKR